MNFDNRITWERLSSEIEMLAAEQPNSLVPLLMSLNSILQPEESQEWSDRTLKFMTYELVNLADNYAELDRLHILNDYFFDQKGFQIVSANHTPNPDHLMMKGVLTKRIGAPLPVTLLYLHLATHLDLPLYPIKLNQMTVLKWIQSEKTHYLDLCAAGRLLEQSQLIRLLNQESQRPQLEFQEGSCLDILPSKQIFLNYVKELVRLYAQSENPRQKLITYDVLLQVDPNHLEALADRALLRQRLGYAQDAILDLKRYFSYVDQNQAPHDLQIAYRQLQSLDKIDIIASPRATLH